MIDNPLAPSVGEVEVPWRDGVKNVVEHRYDPYSETIMDLQITEPRGCWHHAGVAAPVTLGYCFMVSLNPKNKMGGYTGLKHYFAFIRDGSVRTFVDDEGSYEKAKFVNCTPAKKK